MAGGAETLDFLSGKHAHADGKTKYIVVTGGTMSGLGKGTTISSLGVTLKALGVHVTAIKIDPYLNVDAGTMSPYEHGEVYVLEDGGEVDLDLGNYERFLDVTLTRDHNLTSGKVYQKVIQEERKGAYLGKTVQVVPQVTDAIQAWIARVAEQPVDGHYEAPQICLIEVGGTVGDIESAVYLEALQQFSRRVGRENFCLCHVSYVPCIGGEQKTKPTQHGVKELRMAGLAPDMIFCRCETMLSEATRSKIALFTQVLPEHVISVHDVANTYRVPLVLDSQNVAQAICKRLKLDPTAPASPVAARPGAPLYKTPISMKKWRLMADRLTSPTESVKIGIVGKYTGLADSYLSVVKALQHGAMEANVRLELVWIESSDLEAPEDASPNGATGAGNSAARYEAAWAALKSVSGVVCPGGFGDRGILGKALSARYCRESGVPYLGICLGMQTAVIDFARSVLKLADANSEEFDKACKHHVVVSMPEHSTEHGHEVGGTMRLGKRATILRDSGSLAARLYDGRAVIDERHRHRYEVNPSVVGSMEAKGFMFVGQDERGQRMEVAELRDHTFFFCVQYHPEFQSRPLKPSPPFLGLVLAAAGKLQARFDKYGGFLRSGAVYEEVDRA
ncbi:gk17769, related [Neospora caninum Liverpool]|uniref:CTP synthase n=1 Tax=Neospora caninum (strain Liverpool) TaxID=572307 RepID=F0V9N5_NEOCL|nr:gk17769, related [Neospora caninum Liverpool]CBZ50461.1 gk17769, related [Neospora caninum Liverpool]CEL65070.1 TPA: GK17769, related [Neospora caninum Liverpool]|eukprot:XP_003880494.1 gk17769, related [Neospora caninum Liverpool]